MNKIKTGDIKIAAFDYKQKQDKLIAKLFTRYPILVNLWARPSKFDETLNLARNTGDTN